MFTKSNLNVYAHAPVFWVPLVFLLLSLMLLQACAPVTPATYEVPSQLPDTVVYAVSSNTVLLGVQRAMDFLPGASWYTIPGSDKFVFVWSIRGVGLAFFGVDAGSKSVFDVIQQIGCGGNVASCSTVQDLLNYMSKSGWVKVTSTTALPAAIQALAKNLPGIIEGAASRVSTRVTMIPLYLVFDVPLPQDTPMDQWLECALLGKCEIQS